MSKTRKSGNRYGESPSTRDKRFCSDAGDMRLAAVFEIEIDVDRQPIIDDRIIPKGEIASREKPSNEVIAMLKELGYRK